MSRIVTMRDQGPLVLKKDEMESDTVAICRCGLSAGWPQCDGTHAVTQDEDPNTVFQYARSDEDEKPSRSEFEGDVTVADPRPWTAENVATN